MSKIDENEAPEGFRAVAASTAYGCRGCCFIWKRPCHFKAKDKRLCRGFDRKDGQDVIFKKKDGEK